MRSAAGGVPPPDSRKHGRAGGWRSDHPNSFDGVAMPRSSFLYFT